MITDILSQFDIYTAIVVLHVVGTAIGAGGSTLSDLLFFKSIDDGRIDNSEFRLMKTGGVAVWAGLSILILTGIGIVLYQYLVNGIPLLEISSKLQAKLVIVSIIAVNGIFLHTKVLPLFKKAVNSDITVVLERHGFIIFTSGAISVVSWYSALIIGAWRGLVAPVFVILGAYLVMILGAIVVANIIGRIRVRAIREQNKKESA